jgi:hypothetical protein
MYMKEDILAVTAFKCIRIIISEVIEEVNIKRYQINIDLFGLIH